MMKSVSRLLLGDYAAREIRRHERVVRRINELEPAMQALSDDELRALTPRFRERAVNGESLESILPEAFAAVREAARRTLNMRHFDVQLIGGMVLHEGKIAEMATGEGKTLVATLPAYLNALTGEGVHIVTVNDYLAKRDAEWMGKIYNFLGLSVGLILTNPNHDPAAARAAYACDVTYGTNNEFAFDYLRDNMAPTLADVTQRGFHYAIVDEVDSILIDEARTPLIISGLGTASTEWYVRFARVVEQLERDVDYKVDEKLRTVAPTEEGVEKVERMLGVEHLYADSRTDLSHYLNQALKAKELFLRDRDYVVKDNEVIIVDEFTGRLMFGRRYNDGLHQAIEAKEGVPVQQENPTLATVTFQNFFRMYKKLAGMTGTALTEEEEFRKIYGLDVIPIPTNKPLIRKELPDLVFKTERAKFKAVADDVEERHKRGQPVLVGTVSIEKSERLSEMLTRRGVPHEVLNAKHHEREAGIIAQAGQRGAVTIATNMAGRGTDIVLGEGVAELGGLHVIGTERHEARRIDNQLRGRSGRQGDPGSSQFYVSLEDDLMRIFAAERVQWLLDRLGVEEDQPIEGGMLTRAIENAQKKVENKNFEARKQLLEYDDVLNKQREVLYAERRRILAGTHEEVRRAFEGFVENVVQRGLDGYCDPKVHPDDWDVEGLVQALEGVMLEPHTIDPAELRQNGREAIREAILEAARAVFAEVERKVVALTDDPGQYVEHVRQQMLRAVDQHWPEHLTLMDDLKEGVFLRGYAQRDPLVDYRMEAYDMFQAMVEALEEDAVRWVAKTPIPDREALQQVWVMPAGVAIGPDEPGTQAPIVVPLFPGVPVPGMQVVLPPGVDLSTLSLPPEVQAQLVAAGGGPAQPAPPPPAQVTVPIVLPRPGVDHIGRNDPCPCGSGKKYKRCHGKEA
ncbi:MAG: preprotein translocase subunit SecA [Firmicutes bacterium]|nr:preprotein translocase subunit SecA [Bacillota bacterium]